MDFKRYKRFFAFGCSMTAYGWPTWADIIGKEFSEYKNCAQSGGGNLFISCQVAESNARYKFNKDDLVMIMWSSVAREDRYVDGTWLTPGNIYTQGVYDKKFVKTFADEFGYLLRDINLITLTKSLLELSGTNYYMLNMSPFDVQFSDPSNKGRMDKVKEYYKETFDSILPDILTLECKGRWPQHPISKEGGQSADYHPSPKQHFGYLNKLFPNIQWSQNTIDFVNESQKEMEKIRNFDDMTMWQNYDRI